MATEMSVDFNALAANDVCELAKYRWRRAATIRLIWTVMVIVLGIIFLIVIGVVVALILFSRPVEAIVTAVGGVVDGALVLFILKRRGEAVEEEQTAWNEMTQRCPGTPPGAEVTRSRLRLLGL
jgi:hypothetical protein